MNLYGFVGNSGINWVDLLGLNAGAATWGGIWGGAAAGAKAGGKTPLSAVAGALIGIIVVEAGMLTDAIIDLNEEYEKLDEANKRAEEAKRRLDELKKQLAEEAICPYDADLPAKPADTGEPGSVGEGKKQTRLYDEDGRPSIDRDFPHPGGPDIEREDHSHDWDP